MFKGQHIVNLFFLLLLVAEAVYLINSINFGVTFEEYSPRLHFVTLPWIKPFFYSIFVLALIYGILFVLPIGGTDMPVVILIKFLYRRGGSLRRLPL